MLKTILFALATFSLVSVPSLARAVTFAEDFSEPPSSRGWKTFGDASLFEWNATNQNILVTWDSSKPNSYFYRPLGTILAKDDDFSVAFDVRLSDIAIGVNTNKPFTFQIAIGFQNREHATQTNFHRGHGFQAPNLVEFNYFPDSGFGSTISTPMIDTNNNYASGGFTVGFELTPGDLFHIEMEYFSSNQTLKTTITKNGASFGPIQETVVGTTFTDFRLDTMAIASYSDAGQIAEFGEGSVLAHGTVDNLIIVVPDPPIAEIASTISDDTAQVHFLSRTNWTYVLQRTTDFLSWTNTTSAVNGTGNQMILQDSNATAEKAFYRIRAERP